MSLVLLFVLFVVVVVEDVVCVLVEDIGIGDVIVVLLFDCFDCVYLLCKQDVVIVGWLWFDVIYCVFDLDVIIDWCVVEGDVVWVGIVLVILYGCNCSLVSVECILLNFLQMLFGMVIIMVCYVVVVVGIGICILDICKILLGLCMVQKYVVCCGGGDNYCLGLFDMVMFKENYICVVGLLIVVVQVVCVQWFDLLLVVEVEDLMQLCDVLVVGCECILIDDFDVDLCCEVVCIVVGWIFLEVFGSVDLVGLCVIVEDGVDCILIGGLIKYVQVIDLLLKLGLLLG